MTMLAKKIHQLLEAEYKAQKQSQERRPFVDLLFDEILSDEAIFHSLYPIDTKVFENNEVVLSYQCNPGYNSLITTAGSVAQYDVLAFRQQTPFPWLPDFLLLRDQNSSKILLYMIHQQTMYSPKGKIGLKQEIEVSFTMKPDIGGVAVKEVKREEVCDPLFPFRMDSSMSERGVMFGAFYYGLQRVTDDVLKEKYSRRVGISEEELGKAYTALKALADKN